MTTLAGKTAVPRHHGRHEPGAPARSAAPGLRRGRYGGHRGIGSRTVRRPAGGLGHPTRAPASRHPVRRRRPRRDGPGRAVAALPAAQARHRPHPQPQAGPLRSSGGPRPPGCPASSTRCTVSMPVRRIRPRGGPWCMPSNGLASMCSGAELVQNPEDFEVLARLGVPTAQAGAAGQRRRPAALSPPCGRSGRRRARDMSGYRCRRRGGRDRGAPGVAEGLPGAVRRRPSALRRTHPELVFVVVGGTDPEKADAISSEELAAAGRQGHFVFAGDRDDMEDIYPAFDLFVLPSHREGFPRSAMEAAATGLPIVATDIRGCRQAGLRMARPDCSFLSATRCDWRRPSRQLVDDSALRRRMGIAGRRKAEAEFDDRAVVSKTVEAYERVLSTATSSRRRRTPSSACAAVVTVEVTPLCCLGQAHPQFSVAQQAHRGGGKLLWIVGQQQMHTVARRPIPPHPGWWTPPGHGGRRTRGSSPGFHCRSGPARRPPTPEPARHPWRGPGPPPSPPRAGGAT